MQFHFSFGFAALTDSAAVELVAGLSILDQPAHFVYHAVNNISMQVSDLTINVVHLVRF